MGHYNIPQPIPPLDCTELNLCTVDQFGDIDTTTVPPVIGDQLQWDGTNWVPVAASTGSILDRQQASATALVSTTSSTYVDVPGMTLTTQDLGEAGTYVITFSTSWAAATRARDCWLAISVNGVIVEERDMVAARDAEGVDNMKVASITTLATGVANGTVVKVQYKQTESTTYYLERRSLVIDGVPDSGVV